MKIIGLWGSRTIGLPIRIGLSMTALAVSLPAMAQGDVKSGDAAAGISRADAPGAPESGSTNALMQDIVVTATKRPDVSQAVPIAITAFGSKQLEALNFHGLSSLAAVMPNVTLDDAGAIKGYANFAIRGLGIAGTIPSIDPTVGVFVDGIYQGVNAGIALDNFDVEAVEVLRGPQGVLFGRNVTGGAILIRTTKPTDDFHINAHAAVESGLRYVTDAVISGPIVPNKITAKIAGYYAHDQGWFRNQFDGSKFGKETDYIIRPAVRFTPNDDLEIILRAEHGRSEGDGAASRNPALFSHDTFDFNENNRGRLNSKWTSSSMETNLHVGFGNGTITNIFGWRKFRDTSGVDSDSTPETRLHFRFFTDQEQFSDELRYAGTFGDIDFTGGVYYFTQDLTYIEERTLALGALVLTGGGSGTSKTLGAFSAVDWHFTPELTLNLGARFNYEKKDAVLGIVRAGGGVFDTHSFNNDFNVGKSWKNVSPRVGLQYKPDSATQLYGYYARGFRSGGYNYRQTTVGALPAAFNPETTDSFEIGLKKKLWNNRARFTTALFHNIVNNAQRDVQVADIATSQIVQRILNAGRVRLQGFEFDGQFALTDHFVVQGSLGYTDAKYKKVLFDLTGDGVVTGADYRLQLPRLSPWTYGANATIDFPLGSSGSISARLSYNHQDATVSTDNNIGKIGARNIVDAKIGWTPDGGRFAVSVYANNITKDSSTADFPLPDVAIFGGDGPAGPRPSPGFAPLRKGRVLGAELRYKL